MRTAKPEGKSSTRWSGWWGTPDWAACCRVRLPHKEVRCFVVRGQSRLRVFERRAQPDFVAEVLHDAGAILTRRAEADRVLWIDRHRQSFASIIHAVFGFRHQAPHLAAGEAKAVVERRLSPDLPLTQRVAVALVVIRSRPTREEVSFVVSGELRHAQLAFRQQRDS